MWSLQILGANMVEGSIAFTYNYMQFNAFLCTYMYFIGASKVVFVKPCLLDAGTSY
jgi:hypothetical protein